MARSEDLRVEIANPSYTIWPGRFHMKQVRLLVNGDTQFSLEGKDLTVNIRGRDQRFDREVHQPRRFRCRLKFRKLGDVTDVTMESESDVWDASGRFYGKGERSKMAFVVGGQAVSIGVADLGGGIEIMPFARTGWLNERLRAFPQPIELPPAKP